MDEEISEKILVLGFLCVCRVNLCTHRRRRLPYGGNHGLSTFRDTVLASCSGAKRIVLLREEHKFTHIPVVCIWGDVD